MEEGGGLHHVGVRVGWVVGREERVGWKTSGIICPALLSGNSNLIPRNGRHLFEKVREGGSVERDFLPYL